MNAYYFGYSGPVEKWVSPEGIVAGGRFIDRTLGSNGLSREECERKVVRGKHKYVFGFTPEVKSVLAQFYQLYPKTKSNVV
jgi:hypothetical protein